MESTDVLFARLLAVQAGLVAVIRSMPHSPELAANLEREIDRFASVMLPRPYPEEVFEAFESQIATIREAVKQFQSAKKPD